MWRIHRVHPPSAPPHWVEVLAPWLVIAAVVLFNLVMMWRIATATV